MVALIDAPRLRKGKLGRRDERAIDLPELHVEPHLVIGDMAAGHLDGSLQGEGPFSHPAGRNHQTIRPPKGCQGNCCGAVAFGRATPSLRRQPRNEIPILIVAHSHLDCRGTEKRLIRVDNTNPARLYQ